MNNLTCNFLADSLDQDLTSNLLILGLNLVIAIYNVTQSGRSTSKVAGWREYVLLLLLPLIHSSLAPLFWELDSRNILVLNPLVSWLNVVGLRAFIKVLKLGCGGPLVIQDSLELVTLADGYVKLGCSSSTCPTFRSLWVMFVWMDWTTCLLFLQPFLVLLVHFIWPELNMSLSWLVFTLEMLICVVSLCAAWKMLFIIQQMCYLPRKKLKMGYISLIVLLTQVKFRAIANMIWVDECIEDSIEGPCCDFWRSIKGLCYSTAIEMILVGLFGGFCFRISDLLLIRTDLTDLRPQLSSGMETDSDTDVGLLSAGGVVALTETLKILNAPGKKKKERNHYTKMTSALSQANVLCSNCSARNSQSMSPSGSHHNNFKPASVHRMQPLESKSAKYKVNSSYSAGPQTSTSANRLSDSERLSSKLPHRIQLSDILSENNVSTSSGMPARDNEEDTSKPPKRKQESEHCDESVIPRLVNPKTSAEIQPEESVPLWGEVDASDDLTTSNAPGGRLYDVQDLELDYSWLERNHSLVHCKSEDPYSPPLVQNGPLRSRSVGSMPLPEPSNDHTGEKSYEREMMF